MTIRKRGARYHYDFMIRRQRYRGALPEARTKAEAQQAEAKIKNKIYERKFGKTSASRLFAEFVRTTYLPWAKATKRSSRDDVLHAEVFCRHFGNKNLSGDRLSDDRGVQTQTNEIHHSLRATAKACHGKSGTCDSIWHFQDGR